MVNGITDYDVLRIIYEREAGSLLPSSRTYKFPRIPRDIPVAGSPSKTTMVLETNPELKAAIAELKVLLKEKSTSENYKKELLEQIELLEEDIALRLEYLRELAEKV